MFLFIQVKTLEAKVKRNKKTQIKNPNNWLGNNLPAVECGWKLIDGELHPDQGFLQICPKEIDGQLKCSCRKGCSSTRCSCCKSKMKCTQACKCGENCENIEEVACGEGKGHDSFNSSSESESED